MAARSDLADSASIRSGTLEVGKIADAVMFSGTSLDVSDPRPRVERVVQAGERVS